MKVVNYSEYTQIKTDFLKAHDYDYRIETSSMDEQGVYHKEYICEDGSVLHEVMSPAWEEVTIEIHKCTVTVSVKFLRTEIWSSDDAESAYYYEKF